MKLRKIIGDKKGAGKNFNLLFVFFGILSIILLLFVVKSFFPKATESTEEIVSVSFGTAVGIPNLNFLTYIFGGIPNFLIQKTNNISAAIIIFVMFIMLAFTFSDILSVKSLFSKKVAAILGLGLAIIAANMKLLMGLSYYAFSIAAGFGILATTIGIIIPFVSFIILNLVILGPLKDYLKSQKTKKDTESFIGNVGVLTDVARGVKEKVGESGAQEE